MLLFWKYHNMDHRQSKLKFFSTKTFLFLSLKCDITTTLIPKKRDTLQNMNTTESEPFFFCHLKLKQHKENMFDVMINLIDFFKILNACSNEFDVGLDESNIRLEKW